MWKLGILAHEKLSVCNRGLYETSVAFVSIVELRARSVVVSGYWVVVSCRSVVVVVVLLFRFSGNSVAFVGVVGLRF